MKALPSLCLSTLVASTTLLGCHGGMPLPSGSGATTARETTAHPTALAGLRLLIQTTESQPDYACSVRFVYDRPQYSFQPAREISRDFPAGAPIVLEDLEPGSGVLTLTLKDPATDEVLASETQVVALVPGIVTQLALKTTIGGTSGLSFSTEITERLKDYRYLHEEDGFDKDFRNYYPSYRTVLFWLESQDGAKVPVSIDSSYSRIGAGTSTHLGYEIWYSLPTHAQYVDSDPLGQYPRVRHYRWTNGYLLSNATTRQTLTVDRWLSATDGMIQETLSDSTGVLRTLRRDGLTL